MKITFKVYIPTGGYKCFSKLSKKKADEYDNTYQAFTKNVRDCVVLTIKGKDLVIFAHYYRRNDPQALLEKLLKDIEDGQELEITLQGGNVVNGYFPWSFERDILFQKDGKKDVDSFNNYLLDKDYPLCLFEEKSIDSIFDLYEKIDINTDSLDKTGLNFFNFHEKMKKFVLNYPVFDKNKQNIFFAKNGKDTTAYQNFSDLFKVLTELLTLKNININKITHIYNKVGSEVSTNFLKYEPKELKVIRDFEKIRYKETFTKSCSLKKSLRFFELINGSRDLEKNTNGNITDLIKQKKFLDALKLCYENKEFNFSNEIVQYISSQKNRPLA